MDAPADRLFAIWHAFGLARISVCLIFLRQPAAFCPIPLPLPYPYPGPTLALPWPYLALPCCCPCLGPSSAVLLALPFPFFLRPMLLPYAVHHHGPIDPILLIPLTQFTHQSMMGWWSSSSSPAGYLAGTCLGTCPFTRIAVKA